MQYRGRFAPSPTGPLHFGSLIAAVGSYLQARSQQGIWLVRIEDLDTPREIPGATKLILNTLESYGFRWDEEIQYQSTRNELYTEALRQLQKHELTYPCTCTRNKLRITALDDATNKADRVFVYPGTCRLAIATDKQHSIRLKTDNQLVSFKDGLQGEFGQRLESEVGDFIIRRSDGLFAYQLAVVVDDADQKITEIVRGSDLLDNTPRQLYLQRKLSVDSPDYIHLPIAVNHQGKKLSKQTHAKPLDLKSPIPTLWRAIDFLGQQPPKELAKAELESLWNWAIQNWDTSKISRVMQLQENPVKT